MWHLHQVKDIKMAKKKSRSANIARKREKRNRDRKSKQKKIAVEKQRNSHYGKIDEERLHTCIVNSVDLLKEPEFERVHFDLDPMFEELANLFIDSIKVVKSESDVSADLETTEEREDTQVLSSDYIYERYHTEILPRLITPRFIRTLLSALNACEIRLRRIGERDLAEVALVNHSLFEVVPPDIMADHPLIQDFSIKTLHHLAEQRPSTNTVHLVVQKILSEVLESDNSEYEEEKLSNMFSNAISGDPSISQVELPPVSESPMLISEKELPANNPITPPSPDTMPAKALYKNFDGMAIREVLKEWQGELLEIQTDTQLDMFNEEQELYITVTENRVQLHTHSAEELNIAMEALEAHCQSALMYLAKTFEEGGRSDATE